MYPQTRINEDAMPDRPKVSYRFNGLVMTLDDDTAGAWDFDASVRLEVQADARLLAAAHQSRVEIRDTDGQLLDVQPHDSERNLRQARQHPKSATETAQAIKRDR